jgi:hypothetical protein
MYNNKLKYVFSLSIYINYFQKIIYEDNVTIWFYNKVIRY